MFRKRLLFVHAVMQLKQTASKYQLHLLQNPNRNVGTKNIKVKRRNLSGLDYALKCFFYSKMKK